MVDDSVPEEGEIEWAVKRLRNNHSGGPSRMRTEHIKGWLTEAQRAEKEENAAEGEKRATETETGGTEDTETQGGADNWMRFMELIHTAFREGEIAEEAT